MTGREGRREEGREEMERKGEKGKLAQEAKERK